MTYNKKASFFLKIIDIWIFVTGHYFQNYIYLQKIETFGTQQQWPYIVKPSKQLVILFTHEDRENCPLSLLLPPPPLPHQPSVMNKNLLTLILFGET